MAGHEPLLPATPANMPQVRPNRFTRWLGRTVLCLGGWRVVGTFPDIPKLVLIVAPHSSNWDGVWGMAAKIALGVEIRVLGKAQLFWWPLSALLRRLGVIPVDRSRPQGAAHWPKGCAKGFRLVRRRWRLRSAPWPTGKNSWWLWWSRRWS